MSWEQLNEFERCEAVARAIDWTYEPRFAGDVSGYWVRPDGHRYIAEDLPDFVNSFDEVRMVEDEIARRGQGEAYLDALCRILQFSSDGIAGDPKHFDLSLWATGFVSIDALFALLRTTPDQRCRAALQVLKEPTLTKRRPVFERRLGYRD